MAARRSIVEYMRDNAGYHCGYCGQKGSCSNGGCFNKCVGPSYRRWTNNCRPYNQTTDCPSPVERPPHLLKHPRGMWAHSMTVQDYQALIDRGWRRSGKYCYKPTMNVTCCPQYPIRCTAGDYKPSKSNKKVIKRFNRYINHGVRPARVDQPDVAMQEGLQLQDVPVVGSLVEEPLEDMAVVELESPSVPGAGAVSTSQPASPLSEEESLPLEKPAHVTSCSTPSPESDTTGTKKESKVSKMVTPGKGPDPSKPQCQKAKLRRQQQWLKKQGISSLQAQQQHPSLRTGTSNEPKSLERLLEEIVEKPAHKLEVRLVRSCPRSSEFEDSFSESYNVYKRYQMTIHGDPPHKPTERQYTSFLVDSPLQVRLVPSTPKSEEFKKTFLESYDVYQRYQMAIHQDKPSDCDQETFSNFLVDSPLKPYYRDGGSSDGYGSFHQQYIIDGKIVAVGVIDILPSCVSSVYLYYDPDYFFLSLGTYTAVRELAYTRYMHSLEPSIEYYYMGFYIHSCPKMKYKGQYSPSFLLCPETYKWFPIEECRPKLDANKYSRFAAGGEVDEDGNLDIDEVLVLFARQAMPFIIYRQLSPEGSDEDEVREYATFTGRPCSKRMLLYRS